MHLIAQVGKVPMAMQDGNMKYLSHALHVLDITKNMVFVGKMVEHSLQVIFNPNGCFVENMRNQCSLVSKCNRNGIIFILYLDMHEVEATMFANGRGVIADIEI